MFYLLTGIANNILWMLFVSGIYRSLFPNSVEFILGYITKFLHGYMSWYFDWKIAHVLSILAILYMIVLLAKKQISLGRFCIGLILNLIWIAFYFLVHMN